MQFLEQTFLNVTWASYTNLLLKAAILAGVSAILIWFIYLIVVKIRTEPGLHKDFAIRLNFLRSLVFFMLINNLYLFFFIKNIGLHKFEWLVPLFYLSLSPQLIVLVGIVFLFAAKYLEFQKFIKK